MFTFETIFERTIPLVAGANTIQATYSDAANNTSLPSNTLLVTFDAGSGLFMPVPFRPNDEFIINTAQPTPRVEVRVYDLRGDFVIALESNQLTPNHTLAWHGRNGSGVSVKKGPFVAVATIEYPDGTRTRQREIFLYEPRP
ncbi:MAG: hypothetical protein IH969_04960 [Candidatus Krumholzibacteriota bacterium]|nr:hypothetical protein [Candidatus Krumholzibacteriota bacterium]